MIVHEVGHCFNLKHTHSNWEDTTTYEHVTRNPSDSNYNADTAGDNVTDTAALPDFHYEHLYELLWDGVPFEIAIEEFFPYKYVDPISFAYNNSNGDDCEETLYLIDNIDVKNYMSYNPPSPYAYFNVFSEGQKIRIREAIIDDIFGEFAAAETTIESLFEPYKGEYFLAGPLPVDDFGNLNPPLFQPGFKYNFVECSGDFPQPADFMESFSHNINTILLDIDKDETDYRSITHPNHSAIYIVHHDLVPNPYPKKCYNNFNKASSGGLLMKFNDNIINANVTITPQDSTAINNPSLINNLEQGLYKIEKNFNDGSQQQTIILKENN